MLVLGVVKELNVALVSIRIVVGPLLEKVEIGIYVLVGVVCCVCVFWCYMCLVCFVCCV